MFPRVTQPDWHWLQERQKDRRKEVGLEGQAEFQEPREGVWISSCYRKPWGCWKTGAGVTAPIVSEGSAAV